MTGIRIMHRCVAGCILATLVTICSVDLRAQFIAPAPINSDGLNVPRAVTTDPAILYPTNRELQLMAGDSLKITIFGVAPAYEAAARVSLDGTVHLPYAGTIKMEGLALSEAEAALAARLEQLEIYRNPQVSIQVADAPGHVATVLGANKDGSVPILNHKRLFEVLAAAGGVPSSASPVVTIDRPGLGDPIVVDIGSDPSHGDAANIPIFAGDTVTLGSVGVYYVVGAVKTPGVQKLNGVLPTTAMQAIAVSGGQRYEARLNSARLIRTTGSQRSVVPVELKKVLDGLAPDPVLQADDILFVPTNHIKAALTIGAVSTILGLAITAIAVTRY